MLTRSKADQGRRSAHIAHSLGDSRFQGSTVEAAAAFDLPVLSSAQTLDWDHDNRMDRGYQAPASFETGNALVGAPDGPPLPLDDMGFHLDTAGRLDYSTPGAASGPGHQHRYPPIHLDPALADATVTALPPPPPPNPWQIPNYGSGGGGGGSNIMTVGHSAHFPGSRRASYDAAPMRSSTAAAAAEEDKRRRNTVASARFRVKKKAREQALETREKDLSVQVAQLQKRIADLEVENKWLRELLLAKKDVNGTDAESRVLAQLEAALKEARETESGDDDDDNDGQDGSEDASPGGPS